MPTTVIVSIGSLNLSDVSNVTNSGTTVTVTHSADHGLRVNEYVKLDNVVGITNVNGSWQITAVPSTTTWEFVATSTPTGSYTSGGDVTRDTTDPINWEADTDNDLVTADEVQIGEMYADSDFTISNSGTQLVIAGATTDSTRYRVLRAFSGDRYDPVTDTGVKIRKQTSSTVGQGTGIDIQEDYFQLQNIGILMENAAGAEFPENNTHACVDIDAAATDVTIDGVFVKFPIGDGGTKFGFIQGTTISNMNLQIRNCIAVGSGVAGFGGNSGFYVNNNSTLHNCVAYGFKYDANSDGYGSADGTPTDVVLRNCVGANNSIDYSSELVGGSPADMDYCVSSDGTATEGANSFTYQDPLAMWSNPDYDDFRPKAGSLLIDAGEDLSGTFTTDLTGATRSTNSAWEIGPYDDFQVPTAATAPTENTSSIGSGKDYSTVQAWLDATAGHLVGNNTVEIGELYDQEALGASEVVVKGSVTDATHYRELRNATGERYDPISDTGARLSGSGPSVIRIQESHFRVTGVGFEQTNTSSSTDRETVVVEASRGVRLDGVFAQLESGTGTRRLFYLRFGTDHRVFNCIARGGTNAAGANRGYTIDSDKTHVFHCVAHRCRQGTGATGFDGQGAGNRVEGCMAGASDLCFDQVIGGSTPATFRQAYNVATDGTSTGTNSVQNSTVAGMFNSASNSDYRLISTSPGVDLAPNLGVSTDFAGTTRRGPHEAGAYNGFVYVELAKVIPAKFQFRSRCYELIRPSDNVSLALTDHDAPITFRGNSFTPTGGFDRTATESLSGTRSSDTQFSGAFESNTITQDDILARLWDGAVVTEYVINNRYPWNQPYEVKVWLLDHFEFDSEAWTAVLVSRVSLLEHEKGRVKTRTCPYHLFSNDPARGDVCLLSRADHETRDVDVAGINDDRLEFTVTNGTASGELPTQSDGYYDLGEVVWVRGDNVGIVSEIKTYTTSGGTGTITLQRKTPFVISSSGPQDVCHIVPGCDKRYDGGCTTFANTLNFGGDRFLPGTDEAVAGPKV